MLKTLATVLLVIIVTFVTNGAVYAKFDRGEQESIFSIVQNRINAITYAPEPCQPDSDGICFGDYFKVLPKTAYINKIIIPDTIILHTDDQSGHTPKRWFSTTTWNGLAGRDNGGRSTHFGIGLDGVGQFLPMYKNGVVQCRGAGSEFDSHTIQIEMGGRDYNNMLTGKASPETVQSIEIITARAVDLVISLMETYDIPFENIMGHYQVVGSGKTDPGNLYFEEYFLPLLESKIDL